MTAIQTLQINDIELSYRDFGSGPPLLLLHGFSGCGNDFHHLFDLRHLATTHRLIVPDLRGHGATTLGRDGLTHERCARDVLVLMDHLGIDRVSAIGLSMGGNTLLHLAMTAPTRVAAMVLVSSTPRFPESARALMRVEATRLRTAEELEVLAERHLRGKTQIDELFGELAKMAEDRTDLSLSTDDLGRIPARALVVTGDRDPLYGIDAALELFRQIEGAQLFVVPGEGHTPVFGAYRQVFVDTAIRFVDG